LFAAAVIGDNGYCCTGAGPWRVTGLPCIKNNLSLAIVAIVLFSLPLIGWWRHRKARA